MTDNCTQADAWDKIRAAVVDPRTDDVDTAVLRAIADKEIVDAMHIAKVNFGVATIFLEMFDTMAEIDTRQHWTKWPGDWSPAIADLYRESDVLRIPLDVFDSLVLQNALYFKGIQIASALGEDALSVH